MARFLVSFDDGTMIIPEGEYQAVSDAARAVVSELKAAGGWIFGGGIHSQQASIAAPDGSISAGPYPETKAVLGGFSIIEVANRDEALHWASRFAAACRCPQEVREIMYDPES